MSATGTSGTGTGDEQWLAKMRLAVNVLLSDPDEIGDTLETELYAFRDRLDVLELTRHAQPGNTPLEQGRKHAP